MPDNTLNLLLVIIDLHGGAGVYCRILARGLHQSYPDTRVTLLTLRPYTFLPSDHETFDQIEVLNTPVHAGGWRRIYETVAHAFRLRRAVRKLNPDLVLGVGTYPNLLLPLVTAKPVVLTEHNYTSRRLATGRANRLIATLIRHRYKNRTVVVPAEGAAEDLRTHFRATNVLTIPHGLDAEHITSLAVEHPTDLPPAGSYICAVGRLDDPKDYPTLLRAYALVRAAGVTQDLLIVGDGPQRASLEQLAASLNLAAHVHFLGHQDNPFPYVAGARCYVLSSTWEGFGLSLLEAMTLARPCVSTDCPSGPAEILNHGQAGLLVPISDPPALAGALADLCTSDASWAHYAEAALTRSQDYSLHVMAARYHTLFQQLGAF